MTRALYSGYSGSLYQVTRSDGQSVNIKPVSRGGVANVAPQNSLCSGNAVCYISAIYDQSGNGNTLTRAPPGRFNGPASGGSDNLAPAAAAPIHVNGRQVYGLYVAPGTGYRNDATKNIATGDQPEGMYAIFDGTHYNGVCCFDYGNAETNAQDLGRGYMEALHFSNSTVTGYGSGTGPWITADMEDGVFSGYGPKENDGDPTISYRFVTATLKGKPNQWAMKGGNAASGTLSTFYNGVRPAGYTTMHKQGAIILGIGGDNSNGGAGTFYEGVMTSGYPSDATENAVQANIVAAKYTT